MSWDEQRNENDKLLFVDWGVLGEGHSLNENIVVGEKEHIDGTVKSIRTKTADKNFGIVLENARHMDKDIEFNVWINGNASLINKLGFSEDDGSTIQQVVIGDRIRIQFDGMYKTKQGGFGYGMSAWIDKPEKPKK